MVAVYNLLLKPCGLPMLYYSHADRTALFLDALPFLVAALCVRIKIGFPEY